MKDFTGYSTQTISVSREVDFLLNTNDLSNSFVFQSTSNVKNLLPTCLHTWFRAPPQDRLMVSFLNTGDWFEESGVEPLEKFIPPRRYYCVLNMAFWMLFTLTAFFYFAFDVLMSGSFLRIALFFAPLGLRKSCDVNHVRFFFNFFHSNTVLIWQRQRCFTCNSSRGSVQVGERFRDKQGLLELRHRRGQGKNEMIRSKCRVCVRLSSSFTLTCFKTFRNSYYTKTTSKMSVILYLYAYKRKIITTQV